MDTLSFIVRVLEIVSWPLAVIVVALAFRRSINGLLPLLRKLKYKELELEFERETRTVLAKIEAELPAVIANEQKAEGAKAESRFTANFARRSRESDYLDEGWFLLQRGVFDLVARLSLGDGSPITALDGAKLLLAHSAISAEQFALLHDLFVLRNKLHHANAAVSEEASRDFFLSAKRMEEFLNNVGKPNKRLEPTAEPRRRSAAAQP